MVEWASGASERTFNQSAANRWNEPNLPIFCTAANDCCAVYAPDSSALCTAASSAILLKQKS